MSRGGAALALCVLAACARQGPPPVAFADSAAYREARAEVHGFLERDLDGDTIPDVVAIARSGPGYAPSVFVQRLRGDAYVFERACAGPVVEGEDLDTLQWLELGGATLLAVIASTEEPDAVSQSIGLFAADQPCTALFQERLALPRPGGEVVAPGEVRGGVLLGQGALRLIDEPRVARLAGADGEVELLTGVRERRLTMTNGALETHEQVLSFLQPLALAAKWVDQEPATELELAELGDGRGDTAFALRAEATGTLVLEADRPVLVLELDHGCHGAPALELELTAQGGEPGGTYVIGKPPAPEGFVRAAGQRPRRQADERRDVLLLREPAARTSLLLGPTAQPRCLREARAYGFAVP